MRLICLGDSLTFGYGLPRAKSWASLFAQESGWEVINCGINGDTTGGMLVRLRQDILPQIEAVGPCRVLAMGGSNDIFFSGSDAGARANLGAIVQQLLGLGITPLLGIPPPIDWAHTPERWSAVVNFRQAAALLDTYKDWLKRFGVCFGVQTVDFGKSFYTADGALRQDLLLDGIHPNAQGHRQMADILKSTLLSL